jgi:hypothetical protein
MGQSTNGILAYGYDLGEFDKIQGLGEYGELPPLTWYDPEHTDDLIQAAEQQLLTEIAGFTETWEPGVEGYYERERAAKARTGVVLETYCSDSCPMYVLAAHVTTVKRGYVEEIDMAALAVEPEMNGWDEKLRAALTTLEITPTQQQPRWLLCSYWG